MRGALELVQRLDDVERLEAGAHPDHAEAREAEADRDEVLLALCRRGLEVRHEAVRELLERAALDVRQVLRRRRGGETAHSPRPVRRRAPDARGERGEVRRAGGMLP